MESSRRRAALDAWLEEADDLLQSLLQGEPADEAEPADAGQAA